MVKYLKHMTSHLFCWFFSWLLHQWLNLNSFKKQDFWEGNEHLWLLFVYNEPFRGVNPFCRPFHQYKLQALLGQIQLNLQHLHTHRPCLHRNIGQRFRLELLVLLDKLSRAVNLLKRPNRPSAHNNDDDAYDVVHDTERPPSVSYLPVLTTERGVPQYQDSYGKWCERWNKTK